MKKQIPLNHLIFEKIKFRYDFLNVGRVSDRAIRGKLIFDSFYPYILAKEIASPRDGVMRLETNQSIDGYAISERVAEDLSCKKLHISELVTMLGYTKTDISKLLQAVKNREYIITLVGLGGTGSNFLHWMSEMSEWTGKTRIFNTIHAYDDDDFDIPNMLRIPFVPQFKTADQNSKKVNCLPRKFEELSHRWISHTNRLEGKHLTNSQVGGLKHTIIYGAPDIATRSWLSASPYTFIAATHRDSEFSLVENPAVDDELMMETYGKINLSKFLLNHLTMTIKFLEHLRDRDRERGTTEEHSILRANFDEMYAAQLAVGFKAGSKKLYAYTGQDEDLNLPGVM